MLSGVTLAWLSPEVAGIATGSGQSLLISRTSGKAWGTQGSAATGDTRGVSDKVPVGSKETLGSSTLSPSVRGRPAQGHVGDARAHCFGGPLAFLPCSIS